jgi:hypothetical protein
MLLKIHWFLTSVASVIVLLDWLEDTITRRTRSCAVDRQVGRSKRKLIGVRPTSQLEPVHRFDEDPEGGLSITKNVARHSQDLVSVGNRNGHRPSPLA